MWKALSKDLEIMPLLGKPVAKPLDSQLDEFERKFKFPLPKSYRQFAKTFGAGELDYFRIYAPGGGRKKSQADLAEFITDFEENRDCVRENIDKPEVFDRLVFFADTLGSDIIGWDRGTERSGKSPEYPIYVVTRDTSKVIQLVDNFVDFIDQVCLGPVFYRKLKLRATKPLRQFIPYGTH